uniref:Fibronectin type-III domain-containing protein n=1 Tax=Panagrolaimus superbus TaxID=310955 RepID=A0A914YRZ8_9BILA
MVLNLVAVNSVDVSLKKSGISVSDFSSFTSNLLQNENDEVSPKLGMGIDAVVELAKSHEVRGVNKVILIVSSDATSSDDALPSAEIARDEYEHKIMAISVRKPTTELLKDMADNSPSRVIHLSEWLGNNELFNSWFSYAICESIGSTSQPKSTTVTTKRPKQKPTKSPTAQEPSNINVIPISPTSFSVTWTCCTNNKADYVIIYTPDASLSIDKWKRIPARCRDSFGKVIDNLPSDSDYKVCVVTKTSANNNSAIIDDENCDSITLDKETTAPPDYEPWDQEQQTSPCQCLCSDDGSAVIQASCNKQAMEAFRPVATLPPAVEGECPCSVKAHAGRCPSGYFLQKSMCIDVNECQQQNGGCSHGCINTPGDFYCACPHGMMRDPADPKTCINVAGSFDRITELLAQYLHANSKSIDGHKVGVTSSDSDKGRRFKATIKTEDDKILSFEWPAMVRKALRWLI